MRFVVDDERMPRVWLETVTIAGATEPVRVALEERQGNHVLLRQVDLGEPTPPPVPLYDGDQLVVMEAISHVGLHTTSQPGDMTGFVISMRAVPVRREGNVVYCRTLRRGEEDEGKRVHVRPGDSVTFEAGAVTIELDHIDSQEKPTASGYVPLTPVLWAWLMVGAADSDEARATRIRYLLAAARRLDAVNSLVVLIEERRAELAGEPTFGPTIRRALFDLIGQVEIAVVALGRVVDMILGASDRIGTTTAVPNAIADAAAAVKAIRDAYEHVEERALGHVRRRPHPIALTIFDHRDLIQNDRIIYGDHKLDLSSQLPTLLREAREFIKSAASDGNNQAHGLETPRNPGRLSEPVIPNTPGAGGRWHSLRRAPPVFGHTPETSDLVAR